jgi:hypothetical protein
MAGKFAAHGLAMAGSIASVTKHWHLVKAGVSAASVTKNALAGFNLFDYFCMGLPKVGAVISAVWKSLLLFLASPWGLTLLAVLAAIGIGLAIYHREKIGN